MGKANMASSGERRRDKRAPAEVSLTLADRTSEEPVAAATKNLSASGAYVVLDEPLPMFGRYQVHLLLPGSGPDGEVAVEDVEAVAIVVRHDEVPGPEGGTQHYMALYFDRISNEDRERIIEFVDGMYE
jgi:c-di-GMP-binding flagellar brake protein YcgR